MQKRRLGELEVSAIGLGCMGMSEFYGQGDDAESLRTIDRALELGVTLLDTADMYGPFKNEELVGRALRGRRDRVVLATKCGIVRDASNSGFRGVDGSPEYIKKACEGSLARLGVDVIDLYQLHRVDPRTPIEDSVGAMADLVKAGKVRFIGLSEASSETLRRGHRIHPLSSVQTEYSLWSRDPEATILATCKELGIGFLAYSPLGRGFLSGQIRKLEDLAPDDFRRNSPRFQGEAFQKNLDLVDRVTEIARGKGCTPSQLALAWVLSRAPFIVPIPGTKRTKYMEENAAAATLTLTEADTQVIEAAIPPSEVVGTRYPAAAMSSLDR